MPPRPPEMNPGPGNPEEKFPERFKQSEDYKRYLLDFLVSKFLFEISPQYQQAMQQGLSRDIEEQALAAADSEFQEIHEMARGIKTYQDFIAFLDMYKQNRFNFLRYGGGIRDDFLEAGIKSFDQETFPALLEIRPKLRAQIEKEIENSGWKNSGEMN